MFKKRVMYIVLASLVSVVILYFVEQYLLVNYAIKTFTKIFLFITIPVIYSKVISKERIHYLTLKRDSNMKLGLILGFVSFTIVILAYLVFKNIVDFDSIIYQMQNQSKITPANFVFVGLYVTFVNSFLEEFYFRGFLFLNIYKLGHKRLAYLYSATLFSVYHVSIFKTWFSPLITLLVLISLFVIGIIFNYVDLKSKNLLNSWLIHVLADSAIIIIALKLFKIF